MIDPPWAMRRLREVKTPPARMPKPDPVSAATRMLCRSRDHGVCVLCGSNATHLHHRQLRRHGNHSASNLLSLDGHCHTRVHGHVAWATEFGLIVPSWAVPAEVPVSTMTGRWLLTDDGRQASA